MVQMTTKEQRDIPYHVMLCSTARAGGRRRKEGCLELWCLSSQVTGALDGSLISWGG